MPVTLEEIAKAAGVSRGTVDRALHDRGRIRPEVAAEIKKLALEMGYQPSRAGKALAMSGKKIKIGVILQYVETPFMMQTLKGVQEGKQEVESLGGIVQICEIEKVRPDKVIKLMEDMRRQGFQGIALTPSENPELKKVISKYCKEYGIPIVMMNADLEDTGRLCFVGQDNYQSGRTAAGLMGEITGGEGQVGVITGEVSNPGLKARRNGFTEELQKCYPHIQVAAVCYSHDEEEEAARATEQLLVQYPQLTGIYVTGHGVSGVCRALKKAGKDGKIRMIANDFLEENKKWLKEGTINFLIGQDARTQGYEPVMILFRLLFDQIKPEKELLHTEIAIKTRYNI